MREGTTVRELVFLIDLDNTLLDNDGVKEDMKAALLKVLGEPLSERFWHYYEDVRKDLDVIDFYETFRRLAAENPAEAGVVDRAQGMLMDWDFRPRLYPKAIETVEHMKRLGTAIVLSDGDPVFQPSKIHQCGVTQAVDGRVLIFVHKEKALPSVQARFKAEHYVLIDDKPGILMRSKAALGDRLTTVHVLQGKYALDPKNAVDYKPDIVIERIGDLLAYDKGAFLLKAKAVAKA
jgi:FMN phosphatase YigB (HAD superfamily)